MIEDNEEIETKITWTQKFIEQTEEMIVERDELKEKISLMKVEHMATVKVLKRQLEKLKDIEESAVNELKKTKKERRILGIELQTHTKTESPQEEPAPEADTKKKKKK